MASENIPLATLIHMITIKHSSTNYLLWRNQVIPMLRCNKLLSYVDGTVVEPSPTIKNAADEDVPNPDFAAWQTKHNRVLSILLSSLTEESMAEIVGLTNARDVWTALEAAFSHSSPSRAHHLRDELQLLKCGTSSVADYGRNFKALCDQLATIGHPVPDVDKGHWFCWDYTGKYVFTLYNQN